ncbi:MAG: Protease HtpX-like protein [candidate division TM6 bacterium GW2011_GWF2_32_72]|nr:MAG: Protease HtpX-like protein [candidate division TM6 bacterium GW2011_GWF2_32_72]
MIFNQIKTILLLTTLATIFMLLGWMFDGQSGLIIAFIFSLLTNFFAYFYSDKIVLKMYGAQPLDINQYPQIYSMVKELTFKMNIPMPKLWLIPTNMANAFATGRNPEHASVAVTSGIINILDEHELKGVLAHELSHVKNRDILITTIAATIASAIGFLANMLSRVAFWKSVSNSRSNKDQSNPITLLITAILMPIAATMIQLSISRSREYLADESGANASLDPLALASALEKLQLNVKHSAIQPNELNSSTASLFIINPFKGRSLLNLFSTHPPMKKRIERLRQIHKKLYNR